MRSLALAVAVTVAAPACGGGSPAAVAPTPSPEPSPSSRPRYRAERCRGRVPTAVFWDFRHDVSPAVTALVRRGINEARRFFSFRVEDCEEALRVSVTVTDIDNEQWAAEARAGDIVIFGGGSYWTDAYLPDRYAALFHEWYHLVQDELANFHTQWAPAWLVEGSAEWMAFRGAVEFGHYPSLEFVRVQERAFALEIDAPLPALEDRVRRGDAYALGFMAVDLLRPKPAELLRFWRRVGSGSPWRAAFESSFGTPVDRFYGRFARFRARGFV